LSKIHIFVALNKLIMIRHNTKEELEKTLIAEFKNKFYRKMGYYPIITTQVIDNEDVIQIMSLNDLEKHFSEYYPFKFGKYHNLRTNARYRTLIDLRVIFTQIARTMNYTFYDIGQYLGGRHHTTIINYAVLFKDLMETSEPFRQLHTSIFKHIKNKTKNESSNLESIN